MAKKKPAAGKSKTKTKMKVRPQPRGMGKKKPNTKNVTAAGRKRGSKPAAKSSAKRKYIGETEKNLRSAKPAPKSAAKPAAKRPMPKAAAKPSPKPVVKAAPKKARTLSYGDLTSGAQTGQGFDGASHDTDQMSGDIPTQDHPAGGGKTDSDTQ